MLAMEDVLEVYTRPYDPKRPVVCLDETSKQLIGEVAPAAARPSLAGRSATTTSTCATGTANLFMVCEPLRGWRDVMVSDRRTRSGLGAGACKDLVEVHYPDAEQVVLVLDNLNTHTLPPLYEAFPPAEAKRLAGSAGDPLHAQAWQLAEHGRDRACACWPASAWTAGWPIGRRWSRRSRRGRRRATGPVVASTGALRPRMPASSSSACTRTSGLTSY